MKIKEKEIILNRKVVFEENSPELWGGYPFNKFLTKEELEAYENDTLDINIYTDSYTDAESKDIPIDWMKLLIKRAEKAGANYIQIDYHCDHEEYDIYGSKISRPNEEEHEEIIETKRQKKKERISNRIDTLKKEIEGLEKEQKKI